MTVRTAARSRSTDSPRYETVIPLPSISAAAASQYTKLRWTKPEKMDVNSRCSTAVRAFHSGPRTSSDAPRKSKTLLKRAADRDDPIERALLQRRVGDDPVGLGERGLERAGRSARLGRADEERDDDDRGKECAEEHRPGTVHRLCHRGRVAREPQRPQLKASIYCGARVPPRRPRVDDSVRVSAAFQPRIEEVAQRVAEHVEAEDRERQRDRGQSASQVVRYIDRGPRGEHCPTWDRAAGPLRRARAARESSSRRVAAGDPGRASGPSVPPAPPRSTRRRLGGANRRRMRKTLTSVPRTPITWPVMWRRGRWPGTPRPERSPRAAWPWRRPRRSPGSRWVMRVSAVGRDASSAHAVLRHAERHRAGEPTMPSLAAE